MKILNYKPFQKIKGEKKFVQTIRIYDTDRHRYTEKKILHIVSNFGQKRHSMSRKLIFQGSNSYVIVR